MANYSMDGDEWAHQIELRIGEAMRTRRAELGLSAQGLADRCSAEGYPISRSTLAKIESGTRGKVEVTELLVMSRALEISPAALMWHDAPDGNAWFTPRYAENSAGAMREFVGEQESFSPLDDPPEMIRQRERMHALRRLYTAQYAHMAGWMNYHDGSDEDRQRLAELEVELARARDGAVAHGWKVDRRG